MDDRSLAGIRLWFSEYTSSFLSGSEEDCRNINLKVFHTYAVADNCTAIARSLGCSREEVLMSEAIGILHDVGRFPQYWKYRTFLDAHSVNHGILGSEVLEEKDILSGLPPDEEEIILRAVKFHNAFSVPDLKDEKSARAVRMIRDADKIDIWRVFVEFYALPPDERASAVGLGFPETNGYTAGLVRFFHEKKIIPLSHLKTLNDFRMLQMTWVFDLNYRHSFRMLRERGYLGMIASQLPRTDEILEAIFIMERHIDDRLSGDHP